MFHYKSRTHLCQTVAEARSEVVFSEKKCSVKCLVGEVGNAHASLLVVELVHTHVLLLNLDCSVVERVETVLAGRYRDHHFGRDDLPIDAFCALWRNSKNFAHNASELNVKQN